MPQACTAAQVPAATLGQVAACEWVERSGIELLPGSCGRSSGSLGSEWAGVQGGIRRIRRGGVRRCAERHQLRCQRVLGVVSHDRRPIGRHQRSHCLLCPDKSPWDAARWRPCSMCPAVTMLLFSGLWSPHVSQVQVSKPEQDLAFSSLSDGPACHDVRQVAFCGVQECVCAQNNRPGVARSSGKSRRRVRHSCHRPSTSIQQTGQRARRPRFSHDGWFRQRTSRGLSTRTLDSGKVFNWGCTISSTTTLTSRQIHIFTTELLNTAIASNMSQQDRSNRSCLLRDSGMVWTRLVRSTSVWRDRRGRAPKNPPKATISCHQSACGVLMRNPGK